MLVNVKPTFYVHSYFRKHRTFKLLSDYDFGVGTVPKKKNPGKEDNAELAINMQMGLLYLMIYYNPIKSKNI